MEKTLADFVVGEMGQVIGFNRGASHYRQKLLAMGLIKGTGFQVARVAPLGDPVEIKVRGFSLTLRKEEAKALQVKEVPQ